VIWRRERLAVDRPRSRFLVIRKGKAVSGL
jgi:hypothetical protein